MDIIEKQLEYLNQTMKDTAAEANSFLLKYHFGGLVAVLALLNVDLVLLKQIRLSGPFHYLLFFAALATIVYLSHRYFDFVLDHYGRFSRSHRKLKYKYELTLNFSLCRETEYAQYQHFMEQSLVKKPHLKNDLLSAPTPEQYHFKEVADYLLNHHRIRYRKLQQKDSSYLKIADLIVVLTVVIRCIFVLLGQ